MQFTGNFEGTLNGERTTLTNDQLGELLTEENLFEAFHYAAEAIGLDAWTTFQYDENTYIFQNDGEAGFNGGAGGNVATGATASSNSSALPERWTIQTLSLV